MSKSDRKIQWGYFSSHYGHRGDADLYIPIMGHRALRKRRTTAPAQPQHYNDWAISWYHDKTIMRDKGHDTAYATQQLMISSPANRLSLSPTNDDILHSWMRMTGNNVAPMLTRVGLPLDTMIPIHNPVSVENHWVGLRDELTAHRIQHSSVLTLRLELMLSEVWRDYRHEQEESIPFRLTHALRLMHDRLNQSLDLAALCAEVECNSRTLGRLFHRFFGHSPQLHFQALRMDQACRLLEDVDQSISDVAQAAGYSDAFAFSKAFRKYKGYSPTQWRKLHKRA